MYPQHSYPLHRLGKEERFLGLLVDNPSVNVIDKVNALQTNITRWHSPIIQSGSRERCKYCRAIRSNTLILCKKEAQSTSPTNDGSGEDNGLSLEGKITKRFNQRHNKINTYVPTISLEKKVPVLLLRLSVILH